MAPNRQEAVRTDNLLFPVLVNEGVISQNNLLLLFFSGMNFF